MITPMGFWSDLFSDAGRRRQHTPSHAKKPRHRAGEGRAPRKEQESYRGTHTEKAAQAATAAPTGRARGVARASTTERPGQRAKAAPGEARKQAAGRGFAQGQSHATRVRDVPNNLWWGNR